MSLLYDGENAQLHLGDCREVLKVFPENFFDSCVTDAPYGLGFMKATWDREVPGPEYWREVYRVLKPGACLLAMGGTRTFHRLVCAVEDSGFEIRDVLMWLYGSGFPKSHNMSLGIDKALGHENRGRAIPTASTHRPCGTPLTANPVKDYAPKTPEGAQWDGWGTALKPAYEPIVLARKPFKGSVARNVMAYGTGGINIDACRVGTDQMKEERSAGPPGTKPVCALGNHTGRVHTGRVHTGRWPANILHDGSDEVLSRFPDAPGQQARRGPEHGAKHSITCYGEYGASPTEAIPREDSGSASRFFYCAKASKTEREEYLEAFEASPVGDGRNTPADSAYQRGAILRKNTHPTVKPRALMEYLVALVTPPGGVVLDPFAGSGPTMLAALELGFQCVVIDIVEKHCQISAAKLEGYVNSKR